MDAKKLKDIRRRLSDEYENLARTLSRSRLAVEELRLENAEDEGDLASISHERELFYNLHESDFARLRFVERVIKAIDRGQYGGCICCGQNINRKRLAAIPWATKCIRCQEETEAEHTYSHMALVSGLQAELSQM